MAELLPSERLQPALLDRLRDDEPNQHQESREQRVLSLTQLRSSVLRDLNWLFNAIGLAAVQELAAYPQVMHTVLNYGLPDLAGKVVAGLDLAGLERLLRQAILDYEPRLLPKTLHVRAVPALETQSQRTIAFDIEAQLWAQPLPVQLYLKTELDLTDGSLSVRGGG